MVTWHEEPDKILLEAHKTRHEDGGADEISLAGLTVAAEDISFTLEEVATATTLTANHFFVVVDVSIGDITLTLPASASHTNRKYTIKKKDSSSNKVTIDANSTETIDGELTIDLNLQYAYVTIVCDGDEWFIIGGEYVKMEDLLDKLIDKGKDIEELLEKVRSESAQSTLHLRKLSGENITKKDVQ